MFYQWSRDGQVIPGETNLLLVLPRLQTNQTGRYSLFVSNAFGSTANTGTLVCLGQVRQVLHISVDGLGAKYLEGGLQFAYRKFPNFARLFSEGAGTFNARCDYTISVTVPNHISMITGRPVEQPAGQPVTVHHGYSDNIFDPNPILHTLGNTNVGYIASAFDVVHDHGLSTAFRVGKSSLTVCATSYDNTNGAPDRVLPDNGRNKVDMVQIGYDSTNLVNGLVSSIRSNQLAHYTFFHLREMDYSGHMYGWGSDLYFEDLRQIDRLLGTILESIESSPVPEIRDGTVILLTADHGGGVPVSSHYVPSEPVNFTIPLIAWGPGFPAGIDLYSLYVNRADPGTNWVDYNAIDQPLRNGDSGNIALACLGLPPIPGSTLLPQTAQPNPQLQVQSQPGQLTLTWPRSATGYILESAPALGPTVQWTPVPNGTLQTNINTFSHSVEAPTPTRFFRLRHPTNPQTR